MPRPSKAHSRKVSIVSLPSDSSSETDLGPLQNASNDDSNDDEVLGTDFLQGLSDAVTGDDGPDAQLRRESEPNSSPRGNPRRTDDESAALLNSTLSSHGRRPAPLRNRLERRTSHGAQKTTTPRRVGRPSKSVAYETSPNSTPPSAQPGGQHGDGAVEEDQQPRRSARAVNKELKEAVAQAVPGHDPAMENKPQQPKKRGRPPKKSKAFAQASAKRAKSDAANTSPSRAEDSNSSQENAPSNAEAASSAGAQRPEESPMRSSPGNGPVGSTSSEKLSQLRADRANPQESHREERSIPVADSTRNVEVVDSDASNDDQSSEPDESSDSDEERGGLDGLQDILKRILKDERGLKKVRQQRQANDLTLKNESTRTLVEGCEDFKLELNERKEGSSQLSSSEAVAARSTLNDLTTAIKQLDLTNQEEIRRFLFQDVYAHVFPTLLRTLRTIVDYYVHFFGEDDRASLLTPHLEEVSDFTAAIINLHDRAQTSKVKVKSDLGIVRPTRNYIIAPLKRFHIRLRQFLDEQARLSHHQQATQKAERRIERANLRKQKEAAEEERRKELSNDWRHLHILRRQVEPDSRCWRHLHWVPIPVAKQRRVIRDTDASGEPFDRLDVFDHRKRSGQGTMIAEVAQDFVGVEWTDHECLALMQSLAEYTARNFRNPRYEVYRRIIKRHCRPDGALRRFNVLEIVQKAKYLKQMLEDREWAQRIPTF